MTQRTKAAMATQISTLLADNTAGDITASDMRSIETDSKDSAYYLSTNTAADIVTDPTGLTYATSATGQANIGELDAAILATHNANTGIVLTAGSAIKTATSAGNTALIRAYDVDGVSYTTFGTLTANNTPTFDLAAAVTVASKPLVGTSDTSVTDNTLVRYDGTGGQAVQKTGIVVADTTNDISVCGNITPTTGSALRTTTTAANTLLLQAYDTDTGPGYVTFGTLTAGTAPSLVLAIPAGGATGSIDGYTIGQTSAAAIKGTTVEATGNLTADAYIIRSVGNALTAAGTTRTDALVLAKEINNVTTAAAGTGVVLPAGVAGMKITVYNNGANLIKVYGNGSDTIDGTAGSTGVSLTNALRCDYQCVATNTWLSAKLGATST